MNVKPGWLIVVVPPIEIGYWSGTPQKRNSLGIINPGLTLYAIHIIVTSIIRTNILRSCYDNQEMNRYPVNICEPLLVIKKVIKNTTQKWKHNNKRLLTIMMIIISSCFQSKISIQNPNRPFFLGVAPSSRGLGPRSVPNIPATPDGNEAMDHRNVPTVGGLVYLPLWKIWKSIGWLFPIYGNILDHISEFGWFLQIYGKECSKPPTRIGDVPKATPPFQ